MENTARVFVDPAAPGSHELMEEILAQLRALEVGDVREKKERPPEGTLLPDLATVILVLKIAYWSIKVGKAIFDIIKDVRERRAAELNQTLDDIPNVYVSFGEENPEVIELPSSLRKQEEFLARVEAREAKR